MEHGRAYFIFTAFFLRCIFAEGSQLFFLLY